MLQENHLIQKEKLQENHLIQKEKLQENHLIQKEKNPKKTKNTKLIQKKLTKK